MMLLTNIRAQLRKVASRKYAKDLKWFFKTGPGEYGEGDRFLGIRVPKLRKIASAHKDADFATLQSLLDSPYHEERLLSLLILSQVFPKKKDNIKAEIFLFYLKNTGRINNWDLVDLSAPNIVGAWLANGDRSYLHRLAFSSSLWERRIAIVATAWFIRQKQYDDTIKIAGILLHDRHDLIHKAVGWMLREVGKRSPKTLKVFLDEHCTRMPRTMLRYAIEKLPESKRKAYMQGKPGKK